MEPKEKSKPTETEEDLKSTPEDQEVTSQTDSQHKSQPVTSTPTEDSEEEKSKPAATPTEDQENELRQKEIEMEQKMKEMLDKQIQMQKELEAQRIKAEEEAKQKELLRQKMLEEEKRLREIEEREKAEAKKREEERLQELEKERQRIENERIKAEQEKQLLKEKMEREAEIERLKQEAIKKAELERQKAEQAKRDEEEAILKRQEAERQRLIDEENARIEEEKLLEAQRLEQERVQQEKEAEAKRLEEEEQLKLKQEAEEAAKLAESDSRAGESEPGTIDGIKEIISDQMLSEMKVKKQLEEENITADYRPIEITYDIREIVRTIREESAFKEERDGDFYAGFKEVLQTVDSILKKVLKVEVEKKREPLKIAKLGRTELKTFQGRNMRDVIKQIDTESGQKILTTEMETDFYILAEVTKDDNDILATAGPFGIKKKTSQAVCGHLLVNLNNLKIPADNALQKYSNVMTIVHELFHALAFNSAIYDELAEDLANEDTSKTIDDAFKGNKFNKKLNYTKLQDKEAFYYLNQLKYVKDKENLLIDDEHWNPTYLPNDLMVPVERYDTVLSIFSLEYIEYIAYGWSVKTNRKNLQSNFLMDEISDYKDFFSYQCGDEDVAPYSSFCSAKEKNSQNRGCNSSYLMKTKCSRSSYLDNNCFENKALKNENCLTMDGSEGSIKYRIETRGYHSRCVPGYEPIMEGKQPGMKTAYCLEVKFSEDEVIFVSPDGQTVVCSEGVERVDMITSENGQNKVFPILCPEPKQYKAKYLRTACPELCYGNGFCSDGVCSCFDGWDNETNCKERVKVNFSATNILE